MKIIRYPGPAQAPEPQVLVPQPAAVVPPPVPEHDPAFQNALDVCKAQIGTLREELERLSAARAKDDAELQQNSRTIQMLSEEIASLRKAVLEYQKPKESPAPKEPPPTPPVPTLPPLVEIKVSPIPEEKPAAPAPVVELKPEPSRDWRTALVDSAPARPSALGSAAPAPAKQGPGAAAEKPLETIDLPSEKKEGKVALLNKLWDYLNHVAVEIPLRKPDRTD